MSDDEDYALQEEKMRMYRERLQQVAQKHALQIDLGKDKEESKTKSKDKEETQSKEYKNPFLRSQEEDDDFNDRDSDFEADGFNFKAKTSRKDKVKISFQDQNKHPNEDKMLSSYEKSLGDRLEASDNKSKTSSIIRKSQEFEFAKTLNTDEESELQRRIQKVLGTESSDNNDELIDILNNNLALDKIDENSEQPELSYNDILRKYKGYDETDSINVNRLGSSDGFKKTPKFDDSIKLIGDEIAKYRLMLEKSQKEDEETASARKSIENDNLKPNLHSTIGEKLLTEQDGHETLEYSQTSRKDSEIKAMETEVEDTYRSLDNSFSKLNKIIKNSPRMEEVKEMNENHIPSPGSSRNNSHSKKLHQSPATQQKHLGSPADNKNIVYDKFIPSDEKNFLTPKENQNDAIDLLKSSNQGVPKIDKNNSSNYISPLRGRNLAQNDMSQEMDPTGDNRDKSNEKLSPMRIPEINNRFNRFDASSLKDSHRSPIRGSPFERTPERKRFPKPPQVPDDEVLPSFEEFHQIMKDVDEINSKENNTAAIGQIGVSKEQQMEYTSIQETLRSLNEMKNSPYKEQIDHLKLSRRDMDLDYSISSSHISKIDEDNPLDDYSQLFRNVEEYKDDTISMLTDDPTELENIKNSLQISSELPKFPTFKDQSIPPLLKIFQQAKDMREKSPEVLESLQKIELILHAIEQI